ncbi:hypothetical protein LJC31_06055 [Synergistaceae bacterium OttesenSCG-928-I11]|nr:hypothetical protein [Synergistaceae bacterium OttesenSCG-928-I11]
MIEGIGASYFAQNYAALRSQRNDKSSTAAAPKEDGASKTTATRSFSEQVSPNTAIPPDNNVKTAIHTKIPAQATTEVERDENFSFGANMIFLASSGGSSAGYGADGSFAGRSMAACVDESSTPENPVVYVEAWEDNVNKAYRVEIDQIDLSRATRVEVAAMLEYHKHSISDDAYLGFIDVALSPDAETEPSMTGTIDFFGECEKYMSYVWMRDVKLSFSPDETMQERFIETGKKMTATSEEMTRICAVQDAAIVRGEPIGPHLFSSDDRDAATRRYEEIFGAVAPSFVEAENEQTQAWDDFFDERDARAAVRRPRERMDAAASERASRPNLDAVADDAKAMVNTTRNLEKTG